MAKRTLLLIALAASLFPLVACADESNALPSRKVSAVTPSLEHFSPNGKSRQDILNQLGAILGKPDRQVMHSLSKIDASFCYEMDDRSMIAANFSKNELVNLGLYKSDQDRPLFLYRNSKF
jgi:hypothetical protein